MENFTSEIQCYLDHEVAVLRSLEVEKINQVLNLLLEAFEKERIIYIFGNGGSAATASHYQNDFNKGISEYTQKKFRFCCLNDNVATLMAIANDIGYEEVFRFQLTGKLQPGDLVIAISGSGNSKNVINAVEYAKKEGSIVVGLTGYDGGRLRQIADYSLHAPVNSMQITEDIHMIFDHLMMSVFYKTLCGKEHLGG
ncbi:SIS domain-containing protein [Pseudoflavonifractor sp. 524-17]|uniref:SIS domain-containing protein n=1 Tax=Pseudoflavonifractor sp. 524-17 TaxID=2304577 RepID=UPI00137AAC77|nr:SIS domain-containing protein [Pseudoflavonifractor sp. 524-17]NCE65614.1 SIS domain-containing protein [Pseudoflavonifractor sp. 524-17]